ncbi:MAG: hypothetical protein AAF591_23825 [Verrucomicrobiota bacterium]
MKWSGPATIVWIGTVATALSGCGLLGGKSGDDGQEAAPTEAVSGPEYRRYPVGEITFVNLGEEFVLIRTTGLIKLPEGSKMESVGEQSIETGELVLSPERKRAFLVADIRSGSPQVGDRVNWLVERGAEDSF